MCTTLLPPALTNTFVKPTNRFQYRMTLSSGAVAKISTVSTASTDPTLSTAVATVTFDRPTTTALLLWCWKLPYERPKPNGKRGVDGASTYLQKKMCVSDRIDHNVCAADVIDGTKENDVRIVMVHAIQRVNRTFRRVTSS
jgi:hypothetical protein